MSRHSWLIRLTIVCVVLFLLLSVDGVDAKKKGKKKGNKNAAAKGEEAAATAGSTGGYTAGGSSSSSSSSTPSSPTETPAAREAAAKQLKRKRDLLKKRSEKKASERAASLKQAKMRANQLAQKRAMKVIRDQKARASAKQRADALVAKKRKADTPEIRRKGHEKLKSLLKRTAESGTRMINLDTNSFHNFVSDGPRPYYLMLAFTALTSQHSCMYCHVANQALVPVAQAHYDRTKETVAAILASNSTADFNNNELPVFFANIDMARNSELFKELKFTSAPYLILAPPRLGTKNLKPNDFLKALPQKYRFNLQASMEAKDFSGFINKLVLIHVNLDAAKPGFTDLLTTLIVLAGIAFVAFKYGLDILMKLREINGIKFIVLVIGFAVYCWCIAGGMYNILRGTQFAETNKDGSTNYILGDARDQYAAEGLIIGVLNVACAVAVILLNTRSFDDPIVVASGKGAKLSPFQHLKNAISPIFSPVVCLTLFIALWFQVVDIYTRKNWGYRRGFVWRS